MFSFNRVVIKIHVSLAAGITSVPLTAMAQVGISPLSPGFKPKPLHVGLVVENVTICPVTS
jgi:hypothetical protein